MPSAQSVSLPPLDPNAPAPDLMRQLQARGLLITPHQGQQAILQEPSRFQVVACGRRWGKTEMAKLALFRRVLAGE